MADDRLLTPRAIPLAQYTMRHDISAQPDAIYPPVFFQRKELNLGYSYNTQDQINLEQMLEKEIPLARDNASTIDD